MISPNRRQPKAAAVPISGRTGRVEAGYWFPEVPHANAGLTLHGRRTLVERVLAGHKPRAVAKQLNVSRAERLHAGAAVEGRG